MQFEGFILTSHWVSVLSCNLEKNQQPGQLAQPEWLSYLVFKDQPLSTNESKVTKRGHSRESGGGSASLN